MSFAPTLLDVRGVGNTGAEKTTFMWCASGLFTQSWQNALIITQLSKKYINIKLCERGEDWEDLRVCFSQNSCTETTGRTAAT